MIPAHGGLRPSRGRTVTAAPADPPGRTSAPVAAGATERGATKLYWQTQAFNGRARSLYDQQGRLSSSVVYERDLSA